jgi:hypothetical protein
MKTTTQMGHRIAPCLLHSVADVVPLVSCVAHARKCPKLTLLLLLLLSCSCCCCQVCPTMTLLLRSVARLAW